MKYLSKIVLVLVASLAFVSCDDEQKAVASVVKKNAMDSIVEQVGKADVALQLYKTELRKRKENWIKTKQLAITYRRKADEARQEAERMRRAGKENIAALKDAEAEKYAQRYETFKERDAKVEAMFKNFQMEIEEKKVALQILKDEVASLQAMGELGDDFTSDDAENRIDRARELEESIKRDCDRAQAAIEASMDAL